MTADAPSGVLAAAVRSEARAQQVDRVDRLVRVDIGLLSMTCQPSPIPNGAGRTRNRHDRCSRPPTSPTVASMSSNSSASPNHDVNTAATSSGPFQSIGPGSSMARNRTSPLNVEAIFR